MKLAGDISIKHITLPVTLHFTYESNAPYALG